VRATRFPPPLGEEAGRPLDFGFEFAPRPGASASAPPAQDAAAREPPPRHPCAQPPADGTCAAPLRAWCDLDEKPIACCAAGLAATGEDGLCGCPPGGVTDTPGAPASCPKAKEAPSTEQVQAVVRPAFGQFHACYEDALRRTKKVGGRVAVTFELTPEGRIFKARIAQASLPDVEAQACVLREFRKLAFAPPTDGHRIITYPILFSTSD
jgi:TonB family protein